ncbi:zinc finger BED domain-containing protein 5-like [Uloborus diversus]|uniref:zinc finger BED domain-containing protein 5-like n=1 Tax=Uloborus diversus TaxID=327109 RepID=UPI0024093DA3|nr:zinc finger BED domain-containing protein 5-like [Uloborus diversus]
MEKYLLASSNVSNKKKMENSEKENDQLNMPPEKKKKLDKYQPKWQSIYDWLETEEKNGVILMFCKLSRAHKKRNPFAKEGCTSYKTTSLDRHKMCKEHLQTIEAESCKRDMQVATFIKLQGCDVKNSKIRYEHSDSVNELHSCIAEVIEDNLLEEVKQVGVCSLICDETCDLANEKHLGINIRYVTNGKVKCEFLENIFIQDGKADTLMFSIQEMLDKKGINISKMVALGCDDARVMLGKNAGLIARLKEVNPCIIAINCTAHRLALVMQDAVKNLQIIRSYSDTVRAIFAYFNASAVRSAKLAAVQKLVSETVVKYVTFHSIRWLSLHKAVEVLYKTLDSLMVYLDSQTERNDPTAPGLLRSVRHIRNTLENLKHSPGVNEKRFIHNIIVNEENDREEMEGASEGYYSTINKKIISASSLDQLTATKISLINSIKESMDRRFPEESMNIIQNFSAFDPFLLKSANNEEMKAKVLSLGNHFVTYVNCEKLIEEYEDVSVMLKHSYKDLNLSEVAELFPRKYKNTYPNTSTLMEIYLVIPISSASVERSFSTQNRIKNKFRNRLAPKTLSNLIRICDAGVDLENFPYDVAATKFNERKNRRC